MISRFNRLFLGIIILVLLLSSLLVLHEPSRAYFDPLTGNLFGDGGVERDSGYFQQDKMVNQPVKGVDGSVIMPKLGNATAKAALGRATWKLMHTMTLRFPEEPTQDERNALNSYFHLQARLYPCGECAAEFQKLLKKYPPQTSSRRSAALWLCYLHNQVNARLGKPEFDCAHLDDTYDCGCGDAPIGKGKGGEKERDELTGAQVVRGG